MQISNTVMAAGQGNQAARQAKSVKSVRLSLPGRESGAEYRSHAARSWASCQACDPSVSPSGKYEHAGGRVMVVMVVLMVVMVVSVGRKPVSQPAPLPFPGTPEHPERRAQNNDGGDQL